MLPLEILLLLLQILWENLNYWESTQTIRCIDEIFLLMITLHILKACMEKKIVAIHLMLCKTFLSFKYRPCWRKQLTSRTLSFRQVKPLICVWQMTSLSGAHKKKLKQKEFFYLQVSEEYQCHCNSLIYETCFSCIKRSTYLLNCTTAR